MKTVVEGGVVGVSGIALGCSGTGFHFSESSVTDSKGGQAETHLTSTVNNAVHRPSCSCFAYSDLQQSGGGRWSWEGSWRSGLAFGLGLCLG